MELRYYQQEARHAVEQHWNDGEKRTLVVMPTGSGKTVVFAQVAKDMVQQNQRVLVLAHRDELLAQAEKKVHAITGLPCGVEKAESSCSENHYPITIASVQSMRSAKRQCMYPPDAFGTIIIDEAHHAVSKSYQTIIDHFSQANYLGVTATPDRGDMQNLGKIFDSCAYEYSFSKAVDDGYLAPVTALTIPLEVDISSVGTGDGDYKAEGLDSALTPYLEQIALEMQKSCADRKTVVFLPLIRTAQKFSEILCNMGFKAAEVDGKSPDRTRILDDFASGKYNVLCNSMLLTEGWDCPSVDCIVILRPTKIRSLYSQMVGRGTRIFSGKHDLLLLDFLWHTSRFSLCRPANLVCENADTANRVTDMLIRSAQPMKLHELHEQACADAVSAREEALATKLADAKAGKRRLIDVLQYELSIQAEDLASYQPTFAWEHEPPTTSQIDLLEALGVSADGIECAGKAALLIQKIKLRRESGLTTPKQIRFLESKGFNHVGAWRKDDATKLIARIAYNHWQVPHDIEPEDYTPKEGLQ